MVNSNYNLSKLQNPFARNNSKVISSSVFSTMAEIDQPNDQNPNAGVSGKIIVGTERDKKNFTKVFMSSSSKKRVLQLKPRSFAVLVWMLYNIEYKSDVIEITLENCGVHVGLTENTFRAAIKDLINAEIIARVSNLPRTSNYHFFYFNPEVLFKGQMFRYFRDLSRV